jgi:hypothetical protein
MNCSGVRLQQRAVLAADCGGGVLWGNVRWRRSSGRWCDDYVTFRSEVLFVSVLWALGTVHCALCTVHYARGLVRVIF